MVEKSESETTNSASSNDSKPSSPMEYDESSQTHEHITEDTKVKSKECEIAIEFKIEAAVTAGLKNKYEESFERHANSVRLTIAIFPKMILESCKEKTCLLCEVGFASERVAIEHFESEIHAITTHNALLKR